MNCAALFQKIISDHRGILLILLLQVCAAIPGLMSTPLWLDEAYSALKARLSMPEIHDRMIYDAGPPLYYDLLHYWRYLVGESAIALRSLSLLFSLTSTVVLYCMANEFLTRRVAYMACLFWAFSPLSLYYAHEARNYTLFATLMLLYSWFLLRYLQQNNRVFLDFSIVALVILVYTHNLGWFAAASGFITIFLFTNGWRPTLYKLTGIGVVILAYLPWMPTLFQQIQNTNQTIDWVQRIWHPTAFVSTWAAFLPGGSMPVYVTLPQLPLYLQLFSGVVWIIPMLSALLMWVHYRNQFLGGIFVLTMVSLLLPYLYSIVMTPIYLVARTDFFVFPLVCLIAAVGINRFPWASIQYGYLLIFLLASGTILLFDYSKEPHYSEWEIVRYLQQQTEEGDIVLCTGLTRPVVEYYLDSNPIEIHSFPKDMENHLAHFNETYYLQNRSQEELKEEINSVIDSLSIGNTLWILYSQRQINQIIDSTLNELQYQNSERYRVRVSPPIQTQRMGLQKLNEPTSIIRVQKEKSNE